MIKKLLIKNFALIKNLEIDFSGGFSVISGETGAGKSIILEAIALLTGKRSDKESLFDKNIKCVVELSLIIENNKKNIFIENKIDFDSETIIRREILTSGKSRAFINDTPVTLSVLNLITSNFLEIYSQNQSLSLKLPENQLDFLDKISHSNTQLTEYQSIYKEYISLNLEITKINETNILSNSEMDFLKFQINELENSNLRVGEKEQLESKYKLFENSSSILENLSRVMQKLSADGGVNSKISEIESDLKKISDFSESLYKLKDRISSARIDLQDLEEDLRSQSESIELDPEEFVNISNRLDTLNSLLVKHRKNDVSELLDLLEVMNLKLKASSDFDSIIKEKNQKLSKVKDKLIFSSKKLTKKRMSACDKFTIEVESQLRKLGIKSPIFKIDITKKEEFSPNGVDDIKFLFSANKGSEVQEIHKVISGGELSRLMLCFSYLTSNYENLSCLIFDEIDTGVSGEIADLMSEMMKDISQYRQVISVTHLPQIASKACFQFKVYKKELSDRTITEIKLLNKEERIQEIAKMLSGKKVTESSIINAKELLSQ
tara:strand:- start:6121 stop:7770 length:1650 start_codon:yes stop_codon:yes gene_type:complete